MLTSLIVLSGFMAVIAWWLIKQSVNTTPWAGIAISDLRSHRGFSAPAAKIGLWVFITVITSLFCLLISAYSMRMHHQGDWRELPEPGVLWLNTAVLIVSSVCLQMARNASARGDLDGVQTGLNLGGIFSGGFVIGQLLAWDQLVAADYFIASNPANAFFYMLTGLHGLHLLGGLVAWARTATKMWRGVAIARLQLSIELCAIYWHFLLAVWLVLFGLMLAT